MARNGFWRVMGVAAAMSVAGAAGAQTAPAMDTAKEAAAAAPAADPVMDAALQEIGRALFLRCLCAAETLEFGANGKLAAGSKAKPVDWTLDGMDVLKVERKSAEVVELDGVRVAIRWNDDAHEFQRRPMKTETMKVLIAGDSDEASAERTLAAVFSIGIDHGLQMAMPPYWQHYFMPAMPWTGDGLNGATIVLAGTKVDGVEVETPAATHKAMAGFTPEASRDRVQGPVVLQMVIDTEGKPRRIRVAGPLGYGLDAAAVTAAEKTMFATPMVAGKPTAMSVSVKDTFEIGTTPVY